MNALMGDGITISRLIRSLNTLIAKVDLKKFYEVQKKNCWP